MRNLRIYLEDNSNTYDAKLRKIKTELDVDILKRWAVKCAESVLYIYEKVNPKDSRVRDCIQATTDYLDEKIDLDELVHKRDAAANATYNANAAANVAYAAAYASYVANATANVANAANVTYATYATNAAYYAVNAAKDKKKQQELNIKLLLELLVKKVKDTVIARKMNEGKIIRVEEDYLIINM